ncbi:MAG TPA: oligopeptide/dipeptide ABC transporter ATP-binding protein, partial [Acidimicrobiia bacterium]|nr:oligopeptide/dipeptide ABC transporter ATP-binding protein [Acidimicrobiia bacterium]
RGQSGREERLLPIAGAPPSLARIPSGCPFHPRCPYVIDRCRSERPPLAGTGRMAACWRSEEVGRGGR